MIGRSLESGIMDRIDMTRGSRVNGVVLGDVCAAVKEEITRGSKSRSNFGAFVSLCLCARTLFGVAAETGCSHKATKAQSRGLPPERDGRLLQCMLKRALIPSI